MGRRGGKGAERRHLATMSNNKKSFCRLMVQFFIIYFGGAIQASRTPHAGTQHDDKTRKTTFQVN